MRSKKIYFHYISGDIGHTELLAMDINAGDNSHIARKPYTLPLRHSQWVHEELEMLEKGGITSRNVSPWFSAVVILLKKAQPGELHQKCLCIDYCILNSMLLPVIKIHSKAQGVLSLVPLPNIDEFYAVLNGSTVYSSLDYASGYHHIALSPEAQKKSTFEIPFRK